MSKLTRTTQVMVLLLITLFLGTSIVAADYIGPQRTYSVEVPSSCHYTYSGSGDACAGYPSNPVSCTCNIHCDSCLRPDGSCSGVSPHQINAQCGSDGFSQTGFELVTKIITKSYPIAVAGTNWTCPIPGNNGWCHSPFPVQLYGVDNYADHGYYITALEGLLDGVPFFADAVDTITIQIGEGSHHLDFWALSSYGDSSNHFIENYYVDTQDPVINATLSGTPGDNNWFVSDTTLTVTFTDPVPGSGVDFTRALSNGVDFSVASPVIFTEGVYFLQLDVTDFAGHSAQTLYNLMVDTTPPAVTSNQPPVEVAVDGVAGGGYVNGSVVFTGTCSDATSGVNRIEISTGGGSLTSIAPNADGSWTLDWDSSMLPDGTYTPVITAVDNAGNRTDITMQPLSLDNSAPAMSITGGWYIWESGHIVTYDARVGIARIALSVRDDQNRWPAREWDYDTQKLEMDLQWDRKFGDGTIAPIGTYEVLLQAWDRLGNGRYITAHIYIPEAGATAIIPYDGMLTAGDVEPTSTPLPTQPAGETPVVAVGGSEPQPTNTPMPTSTMVAIPISGGEDNTVILSNAESSSDSAPANTTPISNGILWGAAALAAGAAAAVVSAKQLKETRAKVEAEIWEEAMAAVAKRWEQTVAGVVAWNKAAEAQAAHEKEVQAEKEKWLKEINDTNGDVINNLSQEEFDELMQTDQGAYLAVTEILKQQELEQQKADEKAEQAAKTQAHYAASIAAYQEDKAKKASEYSNQVKAFREGEESGNQSYDEYKTYNDKLSRMEEETEGRNIVSQEETKTTWRTILAGAINSISPGAQNLQNNSKVIVADTLNAISPGAQVVQDKSKEFTVNTLNAASPIVQVIQDEFKKQTAKDLNRIGTIAQFGQDTLRDYVADELNTASHDLGVLHDTTISFASKTLNTISPIAQAAQDKTREIFAITVNAISPVAQMVQNGSRELVATTLNYVSPIAQVVQDRSKEFVEKVTQESKELVAKTLNFVSPVAQTIQDGYKGIAAAVINFASPKIQEKQDEFKEHVAEGINEISPTAQSMQNDMKETAVNVLNAASPMVQTAQDDFKESVAEILNEASPVIQSIQDDFKESTATYLNNSSEALGTLHDYYSLLWKNAINGFKIMMNENASLWDKIRGGAMGGVVVLAHLIIIAAIIYVTPGGVAAVGKGLAFLDTAETIEVSVRLAVETLSGDPKALVTYLELVGELIDFGVPGNTFGIDAVRYQDEIADTSTDVAKFFEQHGDEIQVFIKSNGDESIEFLIKNYNNLDNLELALKYGKPAMQLLDSVDAKVAKKLLDNLNAADIENILKLDGNFIKNLADMDSATVKGLTGKFNIIADLGDDAVIQINQHGADILPYLNDYGADGLKLLKENNEAAEFVLKHWDDAPEKVALAVDYGKPAMQLLDSVDATGAKKLLDNLTQVDIDSVLKLENSTIEILSKMEPDKLAHLSNNLEKVVQIGPNADHLLKSVDTKSFAGFVAKLDDVELSNVSNLSKEAVAALGKWEGKDLVNFGSELIARADKDAEIFKKLNDLAAIKGKTGKIDFKDDMVKKLIDDIANNSIQGNSGRFALGKWAGRDGGYIGLGRNNGYAFYESPGDFWNAVDTAVGDQKEDLFWAINQNVLEKQIKNDMIFEYTLDGINSNNIEAEKKAIAAVWKNADDDILIDLLPDSTLPSRMKELREIKAAGYSVEFIEKSNSFVFTIIK